MQWPKTRWGASGIHLGISVVIFLALVGVILLLWFPGALSTAAGGWDGIKLLIGVQLVLGPILTLVVYNTTSKPRRLLVRDLTTITVLQVSALMIGVYIVYNARPLAMVHVFDTFYAFSREDYIQSGDDPDKLDHFPGRYPKIFYVETPKEKPEFVSQHTGRLLSGEKQLQNRVDLYRSMPKKPDNIIALLNGKLDAEKGCVVVDIETPYTKGTVCYHPQNGNFSDFRSYFE
jgi:hypothetical protein